MNKKLQNDIAELGADAFLVSNPANVRYLSGFSNPDDARVLLLDDELILITDGRYNAQAEAESKIPYRIFPLSKKLNEFIADLSKAKKLAIEADQITVAGNKELTELLGYEPIAAEDIVAKYRLLKSEDELEHIRAAAKIADDAFSHILNYIKPGVKEIELALELEAFMRKAGAEGLAFDSIVASGYRSSMPHGTASQKTVEDGELLTLDFGACVNGYNSDMTRTVAVGQITDEAHRIYQAVLSAQEAALKAIRPKLATKELDTIARDILSEHNLAEYFSHGLGHGVGIDIHEAPRLSMKSEDKLEPKMVITIEPGAYIPGKLGVRIEDLVFVTNDDYELVSKSNKSLIQL